MGQLIRGEIYWPEMLPDDTLFSLVRKPVLVCTFQIIYENEHKDVCRRRQYRATNRAKALPKSCDSQLCSVPILQFLIGEMGHGNFFLLRSSLLCLQESSVHQYSKVKLNAMGLLFVYKFGFCVFHIWEHTM